MSGGLPGVPPGVIIMRSRSVTFLTRSPPVTLVTSPSIVHFSLGGDTCAKLTTSAANRQAFRRRVMTSSIRRIKPGSRCPLVENRLWKHGVYSLGVVDELRDAQIHGQRAQHIRLVA